jgi:hypothetical protein
MATFPVWFSLTYCGEGWARSMSAARNAIRECFPGAVFGDSRPDRYDPCVIHIPAWAKTEAFPAGAIVASIRVNVGEVA